MNINNKEKKPSNNNHLKKLSQLEFKNNNRKHIKSECKPNNLKKKSGEKNQRKPLKIELKNLKKIYNPFEAKENSIIHNSNIQIIQSNIRGKEKMKDKIIINKRSPLVRNGYLNKTEEALNFLQIIENENF